jgi:hypothetical protein
LGRREDGARPFRSPSTVPRSHVLLDDVVIVERLRQIRLLLQVHPADQLPSADRKLLALLQWLAAVAAHKAIDVVNVILLNSHHQLVRADFLAASSTLCPVNSVGKLKIQPRCRQSTKVFFLPVVIVLAVKLRVSHEALVVEQQMTNVAGEAAFVPICISHTQVITIVNLL